MGNFLEYILANYMIITKTHNKDNEIKSLRKKCFFLFKISFYDSFNVPSFNIFFYIRSTIH